MKENGLSRKIYLELDPPSEEDQASCQRRILRALEDQGIRAKLSLTVLKALYPLCDRADWKVTVSLAYDGERWIAAAIEEGDTSAEHYGLAVDLGSTSVVMQLIDCNTGRIVAQESVYNRQIAFGEDILTRIFYSKDDAGHLEEIRQATVDTFTELMKKLQQVTGVDTEKCISMVVAGNTTMIHFLIGLDAFCVFSSPYAVRADEPGFYTGKELGIPVPGFVFCYPGKANYLGGDIISGMVATGIHKKEEISLFFDVGTNGELVVGNQCFLLCGAGAAGPALEGGVVKTGMRAAAGAVESVKLTDGEFELGVIGDTAPAGICGSGIVDLLSELFIHGWVDLRGRLQPEASGKIEWRGKEEEYAVCYAPGLWFFQSDINEFLRTKAAAYTMMEYIMSEAGMGLGDVSDFYMAGAFGTHVRKESAVNIGMYPDVELSRIHSAGNSSLDGARMLLLDRGILMELDHILELMSYVQFGAVEDFVQKMVAASALPHTDMERYPSVAARLRDGQKEKAGERGKRTWRI
ncbi:MAG: ASKHA domain-containing protein [Lachnospiraceae bacterium]|nr:ASKHA domain-containing protein [Lachnospiraceae bacterium]